MAIPGYFRPEKSWDLLVVVDGALLASVEFKSQVGSFGNNYNNRTEEAIGVATDLWTAFREGAFSESPKPWLGWLMLLEDAPGSTRPVKVSEPFFRVFEEFRKVSYAERYEILCKKLCASVCTMPPVSSYRTAKEALRDGIGSHRTKWVFETSQLR
jgi:hypothetical protein